MKTIGLTGNIAAGKSTASRCLATLGAKIIDADVIAREIVWPGEPVWQQLQEVFGPQYFYPDGSLNRKKLGDLVFYDAKARAALEAITHEVIYERVKEGMTAADAEGKIAVIDAALLIEAGMTTLCDEVWLVTADDEVRRQRILERDHCTPVTALARIKSQMPQTEKAKYAQVILDNSGNEVEFLAKVAKAFRHFVES